jgi:hypothetical protein
VTNIHALSGIRIRDPSKRARPPASASLSSVAYPTDHTPVIVPSASLSSVAYPTDHTPVIVLSASLSSVAYPTDHTPVIVLSASLSSVACPTDHAPVIVPSALLLPESLAVVNETSSVMQCPKILSCSVTTL